MRERLVNVLVLGLLIGIPLMAWHNGQPFTITLATKIAILALAGVGLNIALGLGGLVSLGHAVFFGIGGYAMGILASHAQSFTPLFSGALAIPGTKSMPLIWLVAVLASAGAAYLIGRLSLRTGGVYFIMITLAFGQMFYYFTVSWPAYGGEDGMPIYVRNNFPFLNTLDPIQFFAITCLLLILALIMAHRLANSAFGLALNSIRQNPERAIASGIEPMDVRLVAFVISGAITGLAGALYADLNRFVSPSMFSWQTSGEIMILVILGGIGRLFGPVAGAGLFIMLEHFLGGVSEHWPFFLGLLLLLTVLFARGGLMGLLAGSGRARD